MPSPHLRIPAASVCGDPTVPSTHKSEQRLAWKGQTVRLASVFTLFGLPTTGGTCRQFLGPGAHRSGGWGAERRPVGVLSRQLRAGKRSV